jgi:hypothetical protein
VHQKDGVAAVQLSTARAEQGLEALPNVPGPVKQEGLTSLLGIHRPIG